MLEQNVRALGTYSRCTSDGHWPVYGLHHMMIADSTTTAVQSTASSVGRRLQGLEADTVPHEFRLLLLSLEGVELCSVSESSDHDNAQNR